MTLSRLDYTPPENWLYKGCPCLMLESSLYEHHGRKFTALGLEIG